MIKVNVMNFKKKIIYTTAILVTSSLLSGCVNFKETKEEYKDVNNVIENNYDGVNVKVNFSYEELLNEEDLIIFFFFQGNIFNTINSGESSNEVLIFPNSLDNCKVKSTYLDTIIDLPSINKDQTWIITFDYSNKTYDVSTVLATEFEKEESFKR